MRLQSVFLHLALFCFIILNSCSTGESSKSQDGLYVSGDFHQHTTYSGGEYSLGHVMEASDKYGLDWWANSDHGGTRELWGRASGIDLGARVTWSCAGIKTLGSQQEAHFPPGRDMLYGVYFLQSR